MTIHYPSLFLGGAISFALTALLTEGNEGAWIAAAMNLGFAAISLRIAVTK